MLSLAQSQEANLKRRVYNIEGFSPTAAELAAAVKKALPSANIKFAPDAEMVRIVRSWPRELNGGNAVRDWGWRTVYGLDKAVEHFVGEFRSRKYLYE
jgi:nucleoside-diphosphate-sugar epimerase